MNGFFQLRRKFFSHPLWAEERVFSRAEAFLDLLQLAAFVRTRRIVANSMIPLERGEVCASERYLATRWKWSTSKVRAYLTLLEVDKMLTKQKKQGITVIKLCNYERYNIEGGDKKAEINQGESRVEAGSKQIEEGKEGEQGLGAPGPASTRRPNLKEALAAASEVGIRPEIAKCWWEAREANDWRKGTQGGGTTPVGPNWRADLSTANTQGWPQEMLAKSKQKTPDGKPIPRL